MKIYRRLIISVSTIIFLLFALLQTAPETHAQRPIVITADQPNIWTLEQAHYLLAQMHRRNLDLKAQKLDALDANAINGVNVDVLKTLLEASAEYDQAKGFTNKQLKDQKQFEATRRQQLQARRSDLEDQSLQLTRQIAELKIKKLQAKDDTEKENIQAQIDQLEIVQSAVKEQITQTNTEIGTLNAPSGDFQTVSPSGGFDKSKFADSLDSLFATTAKTVADGFANSPQLNASLRLDNYLQMQYEILSKQLTLLRDEVGPGERLLFLELPQSINVSYNKADNKWAQSWWRLRGFTCDRDPQDTSRCSGRSATAVTSSDPPLNSDNKHQLSTLERVGNILDTNPASTGNKTFANGQHGSDVIFKDLNNATKSGVILTSDLQHALQNRLIRVVDMFPRQSSLNVNTLNLRSSAFSLKFLLTLLSGFGANGNYQREREHYSQFVQQELYSSAFGKGSREFGWTFNPMPGTKRLMSGVRNTYAVVVIPKEALELVVESSGCYFERRLEQPASFDDTEEWSSNNGGSRHGCYAKKAFVIPVPNGGIDRYGFWVTGVSFTAAKKGERVVVSVRGNDFSSQIGVLIDGVTLPQALGLAQPFILDDSSTGDKAKENLKNEKIQGGFERVGADQLIVSFNMPDDYEGTPVITLVAPGKSLSLNHLSLCINRNVDCPPYQTEKLENFAYMFGKRIGTNPNAIKVDKLSVFRDANGTSLNAVITGENLQGGSVTGININGVDCNAGNHCSFVQTKTLIRVNFEPPLENSIYFTLISLQETLRAEPADNPMIDRTPNVPISASSAL